MEPFFYLDPLPPAGQHATLSVEESRHAGASRRLSPGDPLGLIDGRGGLARARFASLPRKSKDALVVRVESVTRAPPPAPQIELACALPKGDRLSVLLDMAAQLGMTAFTPLLCRRSVHQPADSTPDRWRRILLEACKQSRRLWLPAIHPPASPAQVAARAQVSGSACWIAHPEPESVAGAATPTPPDREPLSSSLALPPTAIPSYVLLIGPEGGFTDEEVSAAQTRGARCVALGSAILRIETAAVALLSRIMLT